MELDVFEGSVAGVTFEPAKSNLQKAVKHLQDIPGDEVDPKIELKHEPTNQYDKNAIRVVLAQGDNKWEVGYIPKQQAKTIMQAIGIENVKASLVNFNVMEECIVGLTIKVVQLTEKAT